MATSTLRLLPILVAAILLSPHRLPTTAAAADNRTRGGFSLRLEASSHDHDTEGLHGNLRPVLLPVTCLAYSVVVRFGTGPQGRDYKLGLGMGALTWIRCKPCQPELPQDGARSRSSYQTVAGKDRLCAPPVPARTPPATAAGRCGFKLAAAQGTLGRETIGLGAAGSAIRDFAFGCAAATTSGFENYGAPAGAVGLGRPVAGSLSLLAQLATSRAAD